MTELAIPQTATLTASLSLVEWAQEARAAHTLAESLCKTPFAGQFKGDALGATAAILRGAELGLTPVTSLAAFDLIQGQPAPKANTLLALAQAAGHDVEVIENDDEHATVQYRRHGRGEYKTFTYTIADAQRLGLAGKDNWKKQPKAMLRARAISATCRLVAADKLLGIAYSAEELRDGDIQTAAEQPRRVTFAEVINETAAEVAAEAATDQGDDTDPSLLPYEPPQDVA